MKKTRKVLSMLLALSLSISCASTLLTACDMPWSKNDKEQEEPTPDPDPDPNPNPDPDPDPVLKGHKDPKQYTYNTYTSVSPSNWNELTYQDNNDTQIMGYIGSSFFTYNFDFNDDGSIVESGYKMEYSAATKLEDVTADYVGEYAVPADAESGYAYKITLRQDLKWDDGTAIKAADFVYTMQQQLDPEFMNYRADSFYNGATVIHNAKEYLFQGSQGLFPASTAYAVYSEDLDASLIFHLGQYQGIDAYFRTSMGFPASYDAAATAAYLKANYIPTLDLAVVATMEGKTLAEIKADSAMVAEWNKIIGWWQTEPNEELHFFVADYTWPEVDFDDVGLFAASDYELVIVLDQALALLKEDGSLSYKAAYNMSSLPLVHQAKYEANKHDAVAGSDVKTSTYNSDVASTASWGPYKLVEYQAGKSYKLERNEHWYGYNMPEYDDQYQTDTIVCETIGEWQTAWMKFLAGEIDDIGMDVSVAEDYKDSDQAYFTPDDYVGSLQLQSSREGLENRESDGINKTILLQKDFRKALSLGLNRADFTKKTTTASMAGFGLFGIMHYYDVESGSDGLYRNSDEAKKVLCEIYGVDPDDFDSLDDAVDAITGYEPTLAKQLITSAYEKALAAGDISATDKVVLTYGSSVDSTSVRRVFDYLNNAYKELMVGTPLEGRFELDFDATFGEAWADDFKAGAYDICAGGWSGAAWDPGYMLMAYLSPSYAYAQGWDTSEVEIEITVHGLKDVDGKIVVTNDAADSVTLIKPLFKDGAGWWQYLNQLWMSGVLNEEFRVEIIAACEKAILGEYYSVPYSTYYSASIISYKWDFITYDYNTFMGYGGIRYATYNYDDAAWAEWVAANKVNGEINYK